MAPRTWQDAQSRLMRWPRMLRPIGRVLRWCDHLYRTGWRRTFDDARWSVDQWSRRGRIRRMSPAHLQELKEELMRDHTQQSPGCLITMTLGSRQLGHRDNRLEEFLQSFLRMTEQPERVEILLKVDDDDDLLYFRSIKRRYHSTIDLRFLVSARGRGYADGHLFHEALLQLRNPGSRFCILQSEDAEFTLPGWDSMLLSHIPQDEHHCFIGTDCSFEEAIAILGPFPVEPVPVYWVRGSLFPVIGFGLLNCTRAVARKYPGWTCLGNSMAAHMFVGDVLRRLWERHQLKLHVQTPLFVRERGVIGWYGNPERHDLRTEVNTHFFLAEHQRIRDEMADAIAQFVLGGRVMTPQERGVGAGGLSR